MYKSLHAVMNYSAVSMTGSGDVGQSRRITILLLPLPVPGWMTGLT